MTDLAEVAASVAQALELDEVRNSDRILWWVCKSDLRTLSPDGSNLTDPYWIWRCVEWLRAQGYTVTFGHKALFNAWNYATNEGRWIEGCPAAEFPARAIHELMRERK